MFYTPMTLLAVLKIIISRNSFSIIECMLPHIYSFEGFEVIDSLSPFLSRKISYCYAGVQELSR